MPARLALSNDEKLARFMAQGAARTRKWRAKRKGDVTPSGGSVTVTAPGDATGDVTSPPPSPAPSPPPRPLPLFPQTPNAPSPTPPPPSPPNPLPLAVSLAPTGSNGHALWRPEGPSEQPAPIEGVLRELFGEPGSPVERRQLQTAANQCKAGARDAHISLVDQADRLRVAYQRACEAWDFDVTPLALAKHLGRLSSEQYGRRPTRVRREVVQRVTQYASRRVERSFSAEMDDAEREVGG